MTIGEKIKQLRKDNHITQEKLGDHLHVSYQAISKWENNYAMPDIDLLIPIAYFFNITTDELLCSNNNVTIHKGYKNRREELMTIYECDGTEADFNKAVDEYEEVLLHGKPTTKDYKSYGFLYDVRSMRDTCKAIEYYRKAIDFGQNNKDVQWESAHIQLTKLLVRNNRATEALNEKLKWLEKEPKDIHVIIVVAFVYYEIGDYETAYKYIKSGEKITEADASLFTLAGDICKKLKKYDEAFCYWDKAYNAYSGYASCLYSKAFLYEELNDIQRAISAWQDVLKWHIREGFDIGPELTLANERLAALKNQLSE